jgi:hypothetical protein
MLGEIGLPIFDGFLFRVVRNDSAPVVYPQNVGKGSGGGGVVASVAGAGGHLEDSMPRVRGDSLVVTLILRHGRWIFLNNLGIIPE